jgi:hypothetical protein
MSKGENDWQVHPIKVSASEYPETRAYSPLEKLSEMAYPNRGFSMDLYIRSKHPEAYRSGQWAKVLDVRYLPPRGGARPTHGHPVYIIEWVDGERDMWPVYSEGAVGDYYYELVKP